MPMGSVPGKKSGFQKNVLHYFFSIGTQVEAEHVLSRLRIGEAKGSDTGNYSCSIPGHGVREFPRAIDRVHVVDGKTL